jgi:2-methylisocitrate lyase-like PEP mutase family enzyme
MTAAATTGFGRLHRAGEPLLLPNAWDHGSAAALHRHGFAAIGTTSLGVAAAAGLPDAAGLTRQQTLDLALGLARLPALISVDIEDGFAEDPDAVAEFAAGLATAGIAGVNLEDGRPDGTLTGPERHAAKIAAVKAAAPELFVNARTDTHWLSVEPTLRAALTRAERYAAAGADGIFIPGLTAHREIGTAAAALALPLNVLYSPAQHSYRSLADAGVARISCGSLLYRTAVHHAVRQAAEIIAPPTLPLGYAETQSLAEHYRR